MIIPIAPKVPELEERSLDPPCCWCHDDSNQVYPKKRHSDTIHHLPFPIGVAVLTFWSSVEFWLQIVVWLPNFYSCCSCCMMMMMKMMMMMPPVLCHATILYDAYGDFDRDREQDWSHLEWKGEEEVDTDTDTTATVGSDKTWWVPRIWIVGDTPQEEEQKSVGHRI